MSTVIFVLERLVLVGLVVFVVVTFRRRRKSRASEPISALELMDATDPAVGTRFRKVAPNEDFLLAIPARLGRNDGWLIASNRRVWWMSNQGRSNAQEAEYGYDALVNVVGGSPFTLPVLSIGTVLFRASRENAEAMSQIIRRQRDSIGSLSGAARGDSAPAAKLGVADELAKFAAMRDSGVLTHEEFERKKRELIG